MDCVICGGVIGADKHGYSGGANAEPIAEGQCCWRCDEAFVLPRRIEDAMREQRQRILKNRGELLKKSKHFELIHIDENGEVKK
jgi:hypothetical protein